MDAAWRTVDIFVPPHLTATELTDYIHTHIRAIAHEGGEFIDRIGGGCQRAALPQLAAVQPVLPARTAWNPAGRERAASPVM